MLKTRMSPNLASPSPRKLAKRIKLFHSYSKSPSKDDLSSLCHPLTENFTPPDVVPVKNMPRSPKDSAGVFIVSPSPSKFKRNPNQPVISETNSSPKARKKLELPQKQCASTSVRHKKKQVEQRRCTCHKKLVTIKRLKVRLSRAEKKLEKECRRKRNSKLDQSLRTVFNEDQIGALMQPSKRIHKWSKSTIKKALRLRFSCGTTGYQELLAQNQPLPSIRTLERRVEDIKFNSGILHEVIETMAIKVQAMNKKERDCVLVLDEMSLTENTEYDVKTGSFIGEVTLPGHTGIASHALTFMIAGLNSRWKQVVAYYYTGDSSDGRVLKDIVLNIIKSCEKIKLKVRAVTSYQGSVNGALWSAFEIGCTRQIIKEGPKKNPTSVVKNIIIKNSIPHPEDETRKLYFIADVPHLFKNFKGMLLTHGVLGFSEEIATENGLSSRKAEVKHLIELCDYQCDKELKICHKFKRKFLTPSHFDKMSVFEAYQVLNRQVAAALEFLVTKEGKSKDMLATAWLLGQVHKWFDLMTSRSQNLALSLKNKENYDEAIQFLKGFIKLIQTLEFGEVDKLDTSWKPVQAGMILTTTSILEVQEILLQDEKYEFLLTARFTQDCLENIFSVVRKGQRKPSCLQFKRHLKAITVAQFIRPVSKSSYEQDDREFLGDFLEKKTKQIAKEDEAEEEEIEKLKELVTGSYIKLDIGEVNSLYNLAGYVARSVSLHGKVCPECLDGIFCKPGESERLSPFNVLLKLREYKEGTLVPVNQNCFTMFQKLEEIFR